ncbi:glyceraldehyde-3-phosphate dehydrogenase [Cytophagaceae bacterium AH-315-L13]|nr:glyceraldehyde-3-phosphate dehydrogenase [Cytophagaceae bacterium AH-315-L13]
MIIQEDVIERTYDVELSNWVKKEKAAIELINIIGNLWFDKAVELLIFRKPLFDISSSEILKFHLYARTITDMAVTVETSLALAKEIEQLDLCPSRIDIGRLDSEWLGEKNQYGSIKKFVLDKLSDHIGQDKINIQPKDVVLYGFGRIGRIAARELISLAGNGQQLRLKAIVTRSNSDKDIIKRAELLRNDSVHGPFKGNVVEDLSRKELIVNGNVIKMIAADNPENIDYTQYGINNALLIDNTGAWRDREGLSKHIQAKGIDKVLLTAPGKGDVPNIVYGINQNNFPVKDENIFSAASCTTNAITPVLAVMNKEFGIDNGHVETVHSYTNDQNLLDNYHKKSRRGRGAPLNMVITETGASKAVAKVIPELAGKLTGNAIRVPTPNASLAILNLKLNKVVTRDEVNDTLKKSSLYGDLIEQIEFSGSEELVSSDIIGNTHASVVDGPATIIGTDNKTVVLYVWYDNEYGYTRQVLRLAKAISKVRRLLYY